MLLKKLDEFEERAQRVWARHEMQKHMQTEDIERQGGDNRKGVWGNNRSVGVEDQWRCHFEHAFAKKNKEEAASVQQMSGRIGLPISIRDFQHLPRGTARRRHQSHSRVPE